MSYSPTRPGRPTPITTDVVVSASSPVRSGLGEWTPSRGTTPRPESAPRTGTPSGTAASRLACGCRSGGESGRHSGRWASTSIVSAGPSVVRSTSSSTWGRSRPRRPARSTAPERRWPERRLQAWPLGRAHHPTGTRIPYVWCAVAARQYPVLFRRSSLLVDHRRGSTGRITVGVRPPVLSRSQHRGRGKVAGKSRCQHDVSPGAASGLCSGLSVTGVAGPYSTLRPLATTNPASRTVTPNQ